MKRGRALLILLCVSLLVAATASAAGAGGQPSSAARSASASAKLVMYETVVSAVTAAEIIGGGYDVVSVEQVSGERVRLVLVLYPWERVALQKQGLNLTLWRNDNGLTSTQLAQQQATTGYKVWRDFDGPNGFHEYAYDIAAANPDLLKLVVLGETWGTDSEPREIVALKLTENANSTADGSRPGVLYSSLQHAREWISGEVNRRLLEWYIKRYREGDPAIADLLGSTELWFLLVANPDGYQHTFDVDRLWRKNLRDNDGDGAIGSFDGVDPNRNFPEHWGYDEEGSASAFSDETYRGPSAGSEPETQAMVELYSRADLRFHVNYHSFGELLLYSFGWQVQTPSADDPIFVALSGTDKKPAIQHFNPGVGADLYITNGETTDWAHGTQGTLAWTPELSEGPNGDGFIFPDSTGAIRGEFQKNLPFALDVAMSAADPDDPVSHLGLATEPFYLDVSAFDVQKAHNPLSDFSFAYSYGDPQPVEVLAKRDLDDDGAEDPVTVHWSVDGGPAQTGPTTDWAGGDRFGDVGDEYYRIARGTVTGLDEGDTVEVWFTGGGEASDPFSFEVIEDDPAEVLVLAAEDRTGPANWPVYASSASPNYLSYYTDALAANGITYDVYDVDAMDRVAPDHLGVLSHYDAVVWYTGNDYLTREPGQVPGTGASTLANSEVLEVRSYLNEGGRLLYTGRHAGWQYANAYPFNPVSTPPFCDGTIPNSTGVECLLLSDDFLQYWLGGYLFIEDGGTVANAPAPIEGVSGTFAGTAWTLNGGTGADNHYPNPIRGVTQSLLTTSSLLKPADFPQFTSGAPAVWDTGAGGAFEPHGGSWYAYSDRGDVSYKRLTATLDVPAAGGELSFWASWDTEPAWDFLFVEAHTPGLDDWVTLPDLEGHTGSDTGESCPAGWYELHPWLERYQGADCSGAGWNGASGRSAGWERWRVDLSEWAGGSVEVSISYASDWAVQGLGVFVDDIDAPGSTGDATFEAGLDGWTVAGPPTGSAPNPNDWYRTEAVGFQEGAVVAMAPSDADFRALYFGFGFEGITSVEMRNDVMDRAMEFLLGP